MIANDLDRGRFTLATTQHELAELVRQLAREDYRDHEIAEDLNLEVNDVRRILGIHSREAA